MATTYDAQLQAAQRQLESECDCCDHDRKPSGPSDGDIYADGWTIGGKRQRVMTLAEWNLMVGGAA